MKKLSVISGALLVINSMFGVGIITIPKSFVNLGLFWGVATLIITTLLTFTSLIMLSYSAEQTSCFSYAKMCSGIGVPMEFMLDIGVALSCYGASLCYVIYVCKYFMNLFPINIDERIYRAIVGLVLLILLFFMSIQRSLDKLKILSWFTLASTIFVSFKLFCYACFSNFKSSAKPVTLFSGESPIEGVGPLILAMGCQQSAVEIYSQLDKRSMKTSIKSMGIGSLLGGIICIMIGCFGAKLFGDFKESNFIEIYTNENSEFIKYVKESTFDKIAFVPRLCIFCFIIVLVFAFPIQTLAARNSIFNIILKKRQITNNKIISITFLQFVLIYIVLILNVNANTVLQFIGITASPMIAFMFPAIILMNLVGPKRKFPFVFSLLMFLMSSTLITYGLYGFLCRHILSK